MKLLVLCLVTFGAVAACASEQRRLLIAPKEGETSWYDLLDARAPAKYRSSEVEVALNTSEALGDDDDIIEDCSSSPYPMRMLSVLVSPSQPQKGKSFSVTAEVELDEMFYGGKVRVYLKYKNMFPVVNKTYKICDLLDAVEDPCPISPGQHSYTFSQTVPSYALAGYYVGKVRLKDPSGTELLCMALKFSL